jgi:hypothetical protein
LILPKTPLRYFIKKQKLFSNNFVEKSTSSFQSDFAYNKKNQSQAPIIPIIPFCMNMNFDIVLSVDDGTYSMYEIIRVDLTLEKSIWLTLDSKYNGKQFIGLPKNENDKKLVKYIASTLGVLTYEANLNPPEITLNKNKTYYNIKYTRIDPEGLEQTKPIDLTISIPSKYNIDNNSSTLFPNWNNRNSHCMNHSSSNFLGLIDIYKTLPSVKATAMKVNLNQHQFKFQKILGVKVKSMIGQTVAGIGKIDYTCDLPDLKQTSEDSKSITYTLSQRMKDIEFQNIQYYFIKNNNHLELKTIKIKQSSNTKTLSTFEFTPSLPDLRFSLPSKEVKCRVAVAVDGKNGITSSNRPFFYVGTTCISQGLNSDEVLLTIEPEVSIKSPEWFKLRPISNIIKISNNKFVALSRPMTPVNISDNIHSDEFKLPIGIPKVQLFKSDHFSVTSTSSQFYSKNDEDLYKNSSPGVYYQLSSKSFPLRQDLDYYPFNNNGQVHGTYEFKVKIPPEVRITDLTGIINGFAVRGGPYQESENLNLSKMEFEITKIESVESENTINVTVFISQQIPKYTKKLLTYSLYATINMILIDKNLVNNSRHKLIIS